MILFRGTGADARRYVEADRSRADDYFLGAEATVANFAALDGEGNVTAELGLDPVGYARWVDWVNPVTGESTGRPRLPGEGRQGSPRFAEMVVNAPKSLSIAAALHPEVSAALDRAQQDAVSEIRRWLARHSVTRVGPRGKQECVPVEQMQTVAVTHRTSRAGDPHRHIHFQIGTRVWAAGKWRGLDTAALFRQQGAIRALGTAVIVAHPKLAGVLDRYGLTLDPATGEVVELAPFNAVMSKRGEQVRKNLERLEAEWEAAHPGETMGPVVSSRLAARAWAYERPAKKPTTLHEEQAWLTELREAGYDPDTLRRPTRRAQASLGDLSVQTVANRAMDRCAAGASAWTHHTVQEHATRIMTEYGVQATPNEVREFIEVATRLALEDCFSILPPGTATPEHVAHLTSLRVVQAETELRDRLAARTPALEPKHSDLTEAAQARGLDAGQERAAAVVASADLLVIVEGVAGAGKTTMLGVAIDVAREHGRAARVVAPTLRAAQVAQEELGVPATSVAALVHAHGWRWNDDGVWTRLNPGDTDPETGRIYSGPPESARLARGERVIVDEAGMLDQDTAIALLTVCDEAGAMVALVGDRAQLAAVGRGGVLDMAVQIRGRTFDMAEVHRFTDPEYADVTLRMRDGRDPGDVFDQLAKLGSIRVHANGEDVHEHISQRAREGEAVTVSSNDEARIVNARIREERVAQGLVDDTRTVYGSDGLPIGRGDVIQTRKNDADLGVANRENWIVQRVEAESALSVREASNGRKRQRTVRLPAEYVAEHAHLSYAATAYGVQGTTVAGSHTVLTDATSAASVYVGMTRGRDTNLLHIVAENRADARAQFIEAMERDRADRGLTDATRRATEDVRGLIADGPVKLVNDEIATLTRQAQDAEQRTERWMQIARHLDVQTHRHQAEDAETVAVLEATREQAEQIRASVRAPLFPAAKADWREYEDATAREADTAAQVRAASRFGKSKARRTHRAATEHTEQVRARLRDRWGNTPHRNQPADAWAAQAADRATEHAPEVKQATHAVTAVERERQETTERHRAEHRALLGRLYGAERVRLDPARYELAKPEREARKWARSAEDARTEIAKLRALPTEQAAALVEAKPAAAEAAKQAAADRARRLRIEQRDSTRSDPHRETPGLGR
ncbi:AAA family ATPase [Microbacterium sp. STN6]|uniref:MobF family relaxase n=1 Tax=Microbacterium sp. STN6 TaxID=2995588 RepID=UPI002260DB63|nr:MobF family relaxase [Microbacterium sp. STN6]MCX7522730.1 AAA family ATPase [Microbacterium sp. STN6]